MNEGAGAKSISRADCHLRFPAHLLFLAPRCDGQHYGGPEGFAREATPAHARTAQGEKDGG